MDLIKSAGRRTRLSEAAYIFLNILLPIVLLVSVNAFDTAWIAVAVIVLSKWRVLAVRPRYWFINIKSNLIDIIIGISFAGLLQVAGASLVTQIILTLMYITWLIYIKPKSRRHFMAIQAEIGLFVSLTAIFIYSPYVDVSLAVLLCWIVGYAAARHAISSYEEEHLETLALCFGLLLAELGWLAYHWTLSYPLFGDIAIPQVAAIAAVISFGAYNLYDNYHYTNPNRLRTRLTVIVCSLLLCVIVLFGRWNTTI